MEPLGSIFIASSSFNVDILDTPLNLLAFSVVSFCLRYKFFYKFLKASQFRTFDRARLIDYYVSNDDICTIFPKNRRKFEMRVLGNERPRNVKPRNRDGNPR